MNTYHHILLNSEDRVDYANTNPANCSIQIPKLVTPECMGLQFAQIPCTFFNITSNNNAFDLNGTVYYVTPGCYNLTDLLQTIANLMNTITPSITYNDATNLVTISAGANFILDLSIPNSIAPKIGFLFQQYSGSNSYSGSYGPKVYETCIFINISNIPAGVVTSNSTLPNASFVVPVNVNKGELIQFYSHSQFYLNPKVKTSDLYSLDIRFTDSQGRLLQGLSDWVMMLKVSI